MHPCGSWDRSSMNALLICSLQDYKINFGTLTKRSYCKVIERKFCVCHEWRKLELTLSLSLSLSLSLGGIHILVQINLPIHCFPLQFPYKGRQICCKIKENYQKHLCGTNPQTLTCPTQLLDSLVMLMPRGPSV